MTAKDKGIHDNNLSLEAFVWHSSPTPTMCDHIKYRNSKAWVLGRGKMMARDGPELPQLSAISIALGSMSVKYSPTDGTRMCPAFSIESSTVQLMWQMPVECLQRPSGDIYSRIS